MEKVLGSSKNQSKNLIISLERTGAGTHSFMHAFIWQMCAQNVPGAVPIAINTMFRNSCHSGDHILTGEAVSRHINKTCGILASSECHGRLQQGWG